MIKAICTLQSKRKGLVIGLSNRNIKNFKKIGPIHFSATEMGLVNIQVDDVIILWGETEQDIEQMFKRAGLFHENTVIIHKDRPTKQ